MNQESAKHGICHVTGGMVLNINSGLSILAYNATESEKKLIDIMKSDMARLQEAIEYFDPKTKSEQL
jgi:hypothetical protein